MTAHRNPFQIAKGYGLIAITRQDGYHVYRPVLKGLIFLGRRKDPHAFRRLVCDLTGFR